MNITDLFANAGESFLQLPMTSIFMYLVAYFVACWIVSAVVASLLRWLTPDRWAEHIKRFKRPVIFLLLLPALWLSYNQLELEKTQLDLSNSIIKAIFYLCIFWFIYASSNYLFSGFRVITRKTESKLDDQLLPILEKIARVLIITLGVLLILQSFGLDVFSLIAGLGLGGLALALAAKDTASNFFGSLMILLDQPFNIGDWIKTDTVEGTVEDIGLRSTRVRTFHNSLVVVPNSVIAMNILDNLGQRQFRRFRHIVGLEYGTPQENVEAFTRDLKKFVDENPKTWNEKTEVKLNALGGSSIEILVYVFFSVEDWSEELSEREKLIFEILRLSQKNKAPIAFPTQTLHIAKETTP